jgi:hypothetical protein
MGGSDPALPPAADADRSRPRIQAEQISIDNGYTTAPLQIRDRYAIEHFWIDEDLVFNAKKICHREENGNEQT